MPAAPPASFGRRTRGQQTARASDVPTVSDRISSTATSIAVSTLIGPVRPSTLWRTFATIPNVFRAAYCVSKAGIDMLVRVAAAEWGAHGIRVNAVGPGVTRTPMLAKPEQLPGLVEGLTERTALGRLGEADDVAQVIVGVLEMSWVTGPGQGGTVTVNDACGQIQRTIAHRH
jgi:NAD(P)-dependent dehydrogenase (short-subunit alcohol dehydrogenase family)